MTTLAWPGFSPLAGGGPGDRRGPEPGGALDLPWRIGGRGGGLVRAFPGRDNGAGGRLSAGSAPARAFGEGARGAGAGGEGVPGEPWALGGGGVCPRPPGVLAEVVVSARPGPPVRC